MRMSKWRIVNIAISKLMVVFLPGLVALVLVVKYVIIADSLTRLKRKS